MYSVARGKARVTEYNHFRALKDGTVYGQYFIDDTENRIKGRLNGIAAIDGNIAVQYLLKHFGIGYQTLAVAKQLFHQALRVDFMWVGRADQVHRNIGIDKDHEC